MDSPMPVAAPVTMALCPSKPLIALILFLRKKRAATRGRRAPQGFPIFLHVEDLVDEGHAAELLAEFLVDRLHGRYEGLEVGTIDFEALGFELADQLFIESLGIAGQPICAVGRSLLDAFLDILGESVEVLVVDDDHAHRQLMVGDRHVLLHLVELHRPLPGRPAVLAVDDLLGEGAEDLGRRHTDGAPAE